MTSDSKNRIVPWLSKQHWQQTYQLVFSQDLDDKFEGFQELLIWKSRVSKLPLGVECTLYLLQAMLQDKSDRSSGSNSSDIEIQLLYSTSIIRFTNLISHLGQVDLRHQPISVIAELVGIPDWLVNIRHEATHAKMPALGVLRTGALVAMDWLEENYWQMEGEQSADVFWPEIKQGLPEKKVKIRVGNGSSYTPSIYDNLTIPEHILTATKMLLLLLIEMPTRQTLNQLQSEAVKQYAHKIWLRNKTNSSTLSEEKSVKLYQPLAIIRRLLVAELEQTISEWVDLFTQEDQSLLIKQDACALKGQCLAYTLNSCWELLFELNLQQHQHRLLWKLLYRWNAAPFLMELLSMKDYENDTHLTSCLTLISTLADSVQDGSNFDFLPTVRNLLLRPHEETLFILPKLEKFHSQPVPDPAVWSKMINLLKIRLKREEAPHQKQKISHIYTLSMVREANETAMVEKPETLLDQTNLQLNEKSEDVDTWTQCTGSNWSRIPIGSLGNPVEGLKTLKLPCLEWETLEGRSDADNSSRNSSLKRGSERFDWNSLVRKRRRRGGLKDVRVGV